MKVTAEYLVSRIAEIRAEGREVGNIVLHPDDLLDLESELISGGPCAVYSIDASEVAPMPDGVVLVFHGVPVYRRDWRWNKGQPMVAHSAAGSL